MSIQSWHVGDLKQASADVHHIADAICKLPATLPNPDPNMYGLLVSQAAQHAEPATTDSHRCLLTAMAEVTGSVGDRLSECAEYYHQTETANTDQATALQTLIDSKFD